MPPAGVASRALYLGFYVFSTTLALYFFASLPPSLSITTISLLPFLRLSVGHSIARGLTWLKWGIFSPPPHSSNGIMMNGAGDKVAEDDAERGRGGRYSEASSTPRSPRADKKVDKDGDYDFTATHLGAARPSLSERRQSSLALPFAEAGTLRRYTLWSTGSVVSGLAFGMSAVLASYSYRHSAGADGDPSIAQLASTSTDALALLFVILLGSSAGHDRVFTFTAAVLGGFAMMLLRVGAVGGDQEARLTWSVLSRTVGTFLWSMSIMVAAWQGKKERGDSGKVSLGEVWKGTSMVGAATSFLFFLLSFLPKKAESLPPDAVTVFLILSYLLSSVCSDLALFCVLATGSPHTVATGLSISTLFFSTGCRLVVPSEAIHHITFGVLEGFALLVTGGGLAVFTTLKSQLDSTLGGPVGYLLNYQSVDTYEGPVTPTSPKFRPQPALSRRSSLVIAPASPTAGGARRATSPHFPRPIGTPINRPWQSLLIPTRSLAISSLVTLGYIVALIVPHLGAPAHQLSLVSSHAESISSYRLHRKPFGTLVSSTSKSGLSRTKNPLALSDHIPHNYTSSNPYPSIRRPTVHSLPSDLPHDVMPAILGEHVKFSEFLETRVTKTKNKIIWLTVADEAYTKKAVRHLAMFMDGINEGKPDELREELVVLCLDAGCVLECNRRKEFGFGGFAFTVDKDLKTSAPGIMTAVWTKINGLIEALDSGYSVVFADGDVFYRKDPRQYFMSLEEPDWDLQIQDEGHAHNVNIGFFFQRATATSTQLWRDVLAGLYKGTAEKPAWDQELANTILDTTERRKPPPMQQPLNTFTSPGGLRVIVLSPTYFWGFHLGWVFFSETAILHMTCADSLWLKFFVAGSYGGWRDVHEYYTNPPQILVAPAFAGTREELLATMKLVIAAAQSSDRAILLPLQGVFVGEQNEFDGRSADFPTPAPLIAHTRYIWSLFPLEQLEKEHGVTFLEPNYLEHASQYLGRSSPSVFVQLHEYAEFDIRPVWMLAHLQERLNSPEYRNEQVVRLTTDEGPRGEWSRYLGWDYPEELNNVRTCEAIEQIAACMALCRL